MPAEPYASHHCVLIPFYQRLDQVADCTRALLSQALPSTRILLVNDGTARPDVERVLADVLCEDAVEILHLPKNQGVAAARNHAVNWCRQQQIELLIMIDSDCVPADDFIRTHIELHGKHAQAACFGGGVVGRGTSLWARLDKVMSWVHSVPFGEQREVRHPYHLPTTNFSVKLSALPRDKPAFDARLHSGEDALLIRDFRARGMPVLFSPTPVIEHRDRETLASVIKHHYLWGYHQYFIQLGGDLSEHCFRPAYRVLFLCAFLPCLPLYALVGSILNLKPWLSRKPGYLLYWPAMFGLWLAKGVAVAEAAWRPRHCLRSPATGSDAQNQG